MRVKGAKTRKVAIVEDDPAISMVMKNKLERKKYEVVAITSGEEAIRRLPLEKPDLIYLDLILPAHDGVEVLKSLRSEPETKNTPVVVFSNLGQPEDISRVEKYGVRDYLVKSNISIDEAVENIEEYLE